MIAQLLKKQDEIELSKQLTELTFQLREKDIHVTQVERQCQIRELELQRELERAQSLVKIKEGELTIQKAQWEKEKKALAESGVGSRRMQENTLREQRIMSQVVHKLGLELFKERNSASTNVPSAQHTNN